LRLGATFDLRKREQSVQELIVICATVAGTAHKGGHHAFLSSQHRDNPELAAPSTYVHDAALNLQSSGVCVEVATPPAGKALIVRQLRIDVFNDPSPGIGQNVEIFDNDSCSGNPMADLNPPTLGETTLPFDPGFGVPAELTGLVGGSVQAEVYTDGYLVASSQVPPTGVTATGSERRQHQQ
jgi:hypothetical protein